MRILIDTSIFPEPELSRAKQGTRFFMPYIKEWTNAGHSVVVIHHKCVYPKVMIAALRFAAKVLPIGQLRFFVENYGATGKTDYELCGAKVFRRPVGKLIPKLTIKKSAAKRAAREVRKICGDIGFSPDVILSDFLNPSLFISEAADFDAPILPILHYTDLLYLKRGATKKRACGALKRCDCVLFRMPPKMRTFDENYFPVKRKALMPSGVSKRDLPDASQINFRKAIKNFIFVGKLEKSKSPEEVLRAFDKIDGATLTFVGAGSDGEKLRAMADSSRNASSIRFLGSLPHEKALEEMKKADCLVMIDHETFGMVYTEAMSMGCIPVCSRGDGIDGIIVDGENGFLSKAYDVDELAALMRRMMKMDSAEIERISRAAHKTSYEITDEVSAEKILKVIEREVGLYGKN